MLKIIVLSGIPHDARRLAHGLVRLHGARAVRLPAPPPPGRRAAGRGTDASALEGALGKAASPHRLPEKDVVVAYVATTMGAVDEIRKRHPAGTVHLHLVRLTARQKLGLSRRGAPPRLHHVRRAVATAAGEIAEQRRLESGADAVIGTARCTDRDVLARAAAAAFPRNHRRLGYVDVLVGAQYGSEGKGHIAAYLAAEYDLLVRVGGPNAGHWVPGDPPYAHHHLPSGTLKSTARLLLGPGAVLNVENLLREIAECDVDHSRLSIDPQAMIIEDADIANEEGLRRRIGSTKQGVGSATSRKVMRSEDVRLAKDARELAPFVRPSIDVIQGVLSEGGRIMLEGTQGTGLSLHHGPYPHVTSRETTASGCIADAGIAPGLVRRVVMVARTYPIRVESPQGGTSGPLPGEISARTISSRSGTDLSTIEETEITTTTKRRRRIGEFDWDMIRRAADLNRPTDVALTFSDYVAAENGRAHRLEQLTPDTVEMIEEIERVTGARVSLVSTGFGLRKVIDRRRW